MRIVEVKNGETISLRHFNEDGTISRLKPEVPIKEMPRLVYDGELPKNLTAGEIPESLSPEILSELKSKGKYEDTAGRYYRLDREDKKILVSTHNKDLNITQALDFNLEGNLISIRKYEYAPNSKKCIKYSPNGNVGQIYCDTYDSNGKKVLNEAFYSNGKLCWFTSKSKEGKNILFNSEGELLHIY